MRLRLGQNNNNGKLIGEKVFGIEKVAGALNNIYHVLVNIGQIQNKMLIEQEKIAKSIQRMDEANRVAFKQEVGIDLPDDAQNQKQIDEFQKEIDLREKEFNDVIFADESALNRGGDDKDEV